MFLKKIITVILIIFCSLFFGGTYTIAETSDNLPSPADIYENNVSSILYIETDSGMGSGVILQSDGTFVTCYHVITDAKYINAQTKDGAKYKVNGFKYINPLDDIAILTLDTNEIFRPISINREKVRIGEKVYTISNPNDLQFVFSDGMINQYTDNIQFSAPISPGSSGGALLDEKGNLLGIITAQLDPSEAQNTNFALPNSYFIDKINNKTILNTQNKKWREFVSANFGEDEFAMSSNYQVNTEQPFQWYKHYRNELIKDAKNMPTRVFPILGFVALLSQNYQDAIFWYKQSCNKNYNTGISYLGIYIAYGILGDIENATSYLKKLQTYHPEVLFDVTTLVAGEESCQDANTKKECFLVLGLKIIDYIYQNTDFDIKQ